MTNGNAQLIQLFGFLKNYNDLKNQFPKHVTEYQSNFQLLASWPKHPFISINQGQNDADALISIRRPKLTPCPAPPAILNDWLNAGWESVDNEPSLLTSKNIQQADKTTITIKFEDDPERPKNLKLWKEKRSSWIEAELPAVATYQLFERIHVWWSLLKKEGDQLELILASGMLLISQHNIRHPILLQRLELKFDTAKPEFSFHIGIEKAELYKALLRDIPEIDAKAIVELSKDLDNETIEPLGEVPATHGFLKRAAQGLFIKGEFLEQAPEIFSHETPLIYPAPCIFLCKRNQGLSQILEGILEDLNDPSTNASVGLKRIIGIDEPVKIPSNSIQSNLSELSTSSKLVKDILFSKPANAEQYALADRLNRTHSVLVTQVAR